MTSTDIAYVAIIAALGLALAGGVLLALFPEWRPRRRPPQ